MSNNKKINLKELDINNIGAWPRQAQMGFCVIVALIIILLGWWLDVYKRQPAVRSGKVRPRPAKTSAAGGGCGALARIPIAAEQGAEYRVCLLYTSRCV